MRSAWSASPTCCRERAASIARLSFQVSLLKWGKRQAMPMDSSFFCDWLFWRLAPPQMRTLNDASAAENPREASVSAGTALSPFSAIRKQSAPLRTVCSLDHQRTVSPSKSVPRHRYEPSKIMAVATRVSAHSPMLGCQRTRSSKTCAHLDVTPHAAPRVHSSLMRQLRLP